MMTDLATTEDHRSARNEACAQSLASQNKGGLVLGLAGAALGCLTGNPLLILAGLASGFFAGSVGIDRREGVVDNFLSNRQTLGEIASQPGEIVSIDRPLVAEQSRHPRSTMTNSSGLQNVSYDATFAERNGALVAPPGGAKQTIRRHR